MGPSTVDRSPVSFRTSSKDVGQSWSLVRSWVQTDRGCGDEEKGKSIETQSPRDQDRTVEVVTNRKKLVDLNLW